MGNNWKKIPLGELISLQRGHDLPSQNRVDGQIPIMGSSGLTGWHDTSKCSGPGVVIGRSGNSMGVVSYSESDFWPLNTCLYVTDFKGNDERYIYYMLQQIDFDQFNSGSAQKSLNRNAVYPYEVTATTDVNEQKRIGKLLANFENEISINRQINQTLEQMALALFKSWFVDFDPVVDNALDAGFFEQDLAFSDELLRRAAARRAVREHGAYLEKSMPLPDAIRQLFPATFEECVEPSLGLGGWVPKGWVVGELQDLLVLQRGFDLPASTRTPGAYPLIAASGPNGTHNIAMAKGPGVVTGRSGVLGKVFLTLEDYWPLNTTLWVKEFKHATPCYAYELLRMLDFSAFNAGSAVPTLNRNHIHSLRYLLPSIALIQEFEAQAILMHQHVLANTKQTETLSTLRDTLLPKLISGELRLDNIEADLTKVEVA